VRISGAEKMLEFIVTACLLADLTRCKTVNLTYAAEGTSPKQCVKSGMPELAKWSAGHPNWVPMRWTCRSANYKSI